MIGPRTRIFVTLAQVKRGDVIATARGTTMSAMPLSYPRLCIPQFIALDLPFETGSYKPRPVLANNRALPRAWQARFEQICVISWPSNQLPPYYTTL